MKIFDNEEIISEVLKRAPKDWDRLLQGYGHDGILATYELAHRGLVEIKVVAAVSGQDNPWRCPLWRAKPSDPAPC